MKLAEFVPPTPHPLWKLCLQMGITDVIVKVNPELTGLRDPWKSETLESIVSRLAESGLTVVGLEGNIQTDRTAATDPSRNTIC